MAIRLERGIGQSRVISLGYGVSLTFRALGFAEFKECEATAMRRATDEAPQADAMQMDALDDEDMPPEVQDGIRGRFAQNLTCMLVLRFCTGWAGVENEDGTRAVLNLENITQFLAMFPGAGQVLQAELLGPYRGVVTEGNASAPSPNSASQVD